MSASTGFQRDRGSGGFAPTTGLTVVDEARRLSDLILAGGDAEDAAAVLNHEVTGLELFWSPAAEALPSEEMVSVLDYWSGLPQSDGLPNVMRVEPERLLKALGYIMLLDVGESLYDLRYALYGSKIAAVSGFDLTGKSVWDIPTVSAVQILFAACYMAVGLAKRPLYSVHAAPPSITVNSWHRLILPLGKDGEVQRFLVCNQPIKAGRTH